MLTVRKKHGGIDRREPVAGQPPFGDSERRVQADGSDFSGSDLFAANFKHARLHNAKFVAAKLGDATFRDADLTNADLSTAQLDSTDFSDADLSGAILAETFPRGMKIDGAKALIQSGDGFGTSSIRVQPGRI
jgi:hypothetical protein